MAYNNYKYVIINASEVSDIDFSKVLQVDVNSLRYNNSRDKTFVKFDGDTPSFLNSKTQYTHEEMLSHVRNPDNGWILED
jgi:hypothetical protein